MCIRDRTLATPGQDLERRRVRLGEHVGLVHTGETLDRGAVEPDAFGERALELGGCDRDRLEVTEHVGEPQPYEANITLLECAKNELFLLAHSAPPETSFHLVRCVPAKCVAAMFQPVSYTHLRAHET